MAPPTSEEKEHALALLVAALESFQRAFDAWASTPPDAPERDRMRRAAEARLEEARAAVERVEALAAREARPEA